MNDQFANPFRKKPEGDERPARRPSAPPPGGSPKEMVRLYIMALVFFMAVGTMIYMWKTAATPPKKKAAPGIGYVIRPDGTRVGPDGPAPADAPALPPVKKDVPLQELPKDGVVDFKKLAEPFLDGVEKPQKETPEFVAMLRVMLNAVTPEMMSKRVDPALTADLAYLDAQKRRGEVVRVYGRLVKIYTEPLDTTIPENLKFVYLGIMMEFPTNRTVWFYMPEKPVNAAGQPIEFKKRTRGGEEFYEDWVEVEGVVLRRYDYPSQFDTEKGDTAWARSLVLFSKAPRLVAKPEIGNKKAGFITAVVVAAVVLIAIILTAGIMSRKYGGGDGSMRLAVVAAKREKAKAKGESFFPAPNPAKQILGPELAKPEDAPAAVKDVPPAP